MSRWPPDARERLETAALDLFVDNGYEETTVAQIADRAGMNRATFFRHFADKREVLFGGEDVLAGLSADATRAAPPGAPPPRGQQAARARAGAARTPKRSAAAGRRVRWGARPARRGGDPPVMDIIAQACYWGHRFPGSSRRRPICRCRDRGGGGTGRRRGRPGRGTGCG